MKPNKSIHQEEFNHTYITGHGICKYLECSRPTLMRIRADKLIPDPIQLDGRNTFLWIRTEVMPTLSAYIIHLNNKRNK